MMQFLLIGFHSVGKASKLNFLLDGAIFSGLVCKGSIKQILALFLFSASAYYRANWINCRQSYHPAAQDWFPTEAKQGWAGQYLDGRPPGKTRLLLEEVLVRPAGGAHPVVCVGIVTGTVYCQKAMSFGWDVKPRSWLSVVIKNPRVSFEKSRGVTSASWPNLPIGLWPSWPPNHPHTLIGFISLSPLHL